MLCQPLYKYIAFKKLKEEVLDLINKIKVEKNQIICQTINYEEPNWEIGIGSIEELDEKEERSYRFINPELSGTEIEKFILYHKGFRTRIMIMPPRQCYSIHSDPAPRIHLPIHTNNQCWMIWPQDSKCFQLIEGVVYRTDTRKSHTFINGSGNERRIHLVMSIDP